MTDKLDLAALKTAYANLKAPWVISGNDQMTLIEGISALLAEVERLDEVYDNAMHQLNLVERDRDRLQEEVGLLNTANDILIREAETRDAEVERLQAHANKAYDECFRLIADRDRLRDMLIPRLRDEARVNLLVEQNELNYKLMKGGMTVEEYDAKNVELEQSYRAALDAPGVNGDERIYKGAISDQGSDGRRPGQSIE